MGRRERNRAATRDGIIETAYRLFSQRGYDATTVDHIAAEAGVSPRTFYRYFPSKDAVLADGGYAIVDEVVDRVSDNPTAAELLQAFASCIQAVMAHDDFQMLVRLLRENAQVAEKGPLWRHGWSERLAEGLAARAGLVAPAVECRILSAVVLYLVTLGLDEWFEGGREEEIDALIREVAGLAERELVPLAW